MLRFFFLFSTIVTFGSVCSASDIPETNCGAVFKVPVDQVEQVEQGFVEFGNWIKDTHPMGDEENGLDSFTITKGAPTEGHVYYVLVERYRTTEGLRNHQSIYSRDVNGDYASMFSKLSFGIYRVYGSVQTKTLFSIVP